MALPSLYHDYESSSPSLAGFIVLAICLGLTYLAQNTSSDLFYIIIVGPPLLLLVAQIFIWLAFGRDKRSKLPIVAQYEPPDNLGPAQVRYLLTNRFDARSLSAEIFHLANLGYIRLEHSENSILATKIADASLMLPKYRRAIMEHLFFWTNGIYIKNGTHLESRVVKDIAKILAQDLTNETYYRFNPYRAQLLYQIISVNLLMLGLTIVYISETNIMLPALANLFLAAYFWFFARLMPSLTSLGADTKHFVKGLKLYLSVTDKDRLNFEHPPQKTYDHFNHLLPYAIALGVEKQWSSHFKTIINNEHLRPSKNVDDFWSDYNIINISDLLS
jgi:uncharacterized membrane protein